MAIPWAMSFEANWGAVKFLRLDSNKQEIGLSGIDLQSWEALEIQPKVLPQFFYHDPGLVGVSLVA